MSLLSIDDLWISFASGRGHESRVVEGVELAMEPGEKLALVGESGSGKSVTALAVLGLHERARTRYRGRIQFQGQDLLALPEAKLRHVRGRDISMIFQEPMTSLNPVYPIGAQLVEPMRLHLGLDGGAARARAIDLLGRTGIPDPESRLASYPHQLSGGQRQRVMIAMALACEPKLLIADEPTTALDVTIQKQILELLARLQRELGLAVLLITHDLNLVRHFADRVAVMQEGRLVEQGRVGPVFEAPEHPYTRRLLDSQPVPLAAEPVQRPLLLRGEGIRCHFPIKAGFFRRRIGEIRAVDEVDIELRQGETLGVVGESGSGKTTLGMCLLRLEDCEGRIEFDGRQLQGLRQRQLRPLRRAFQVVFQDPYSSLSPRMTIDAIIGEGLDIHFPQLSRAQKRERIERVLGEVGLETAMLGRYPHEFSGGQRQRIAIARAAVLEPRLILLDEPTSALDVSVQKQVLELLKRLQADHGISYLFISHDLKVIRAIAHRVLVMREGRIVEHGDTETLFERPRQPYTHELLNAALFTDVR